MTVANLDALDKLRSALAEALRYGGAVFTAEAIESLLPVVDRIANEHAAAELRAAGRAIQRIGFGVHDDVAMIPLNRADGLDPT